VGREVAAWHRVFRAPSGREGFTAIELLVAAVVGLLVTGAALALCAVGNRAVASLVASHAAWSETRAAAALWAAEWRGVGYDPTGASGARVERVAAAAMDLSADWNGNGLLVPTDANPNERLSYSVGAGTWRRGVNGGPRLLAAWPDSARFAYRDSQGRELGPAPDPARAWIAEVRVRLPGGRRSASMEARWAAVRRNP
jgi:hypothetical protein